MTIHEKVEKEAGWIEPYIILFKDEYPTDVWEEYCDLMHESTYCTQIAVKITETVGLYQGEENED